MLAFGLGRCLVVAAPALCVAAACGDNRPQTQIIMDISDEAPAYGRTPFPTDALRDGPHLARIAGLEQITKSHADLISAHLAALDGWGLRPTIEFFVDGPVDPTTIPETTNGLTGALGLVDESGAGGYAMDWRYDADRNVIIGSPHMGVQLNEGATYGAFITSDVKTPEGRPLFGALSLATLANEPPERWQSTAELYAKLDSEPELQGSRSMIPR
jgi:hypothetical protein